MQRQFYSSMHARLARQQPFLSSDEEFRLAIRFKDEGDQQAGHTLIMSHYRLILKKAYLYARTYRHVTVDDLISEGTAGALEALIRFEPNRGYKFATYADWWIRAGMQDYVMRNFTVRCGLSSTAKTIFFNIGRALNEERITDVTALTQEQILRLARKLKVTTGDVISHLQRFQPNISLDAPVSTEDDTVNRGDVFEDRNATNPEQYTLESIDSFREKMAMIGALKKLSPREQRVIVRRRFSDEPETLEVIGNSMRISKERVRQIEARAFQKLKSMTLSTLKENC